MNLSLAADSRSWWLPSAIVGTLAAVILGAILILPMIGNTAPVDDAPNAPAVSVPLDRRALPTCFREYPQRHYGVDKRPQPGCR